MSSEQGIRNGIARLTTMYTKEQTEDGFLPKGATYFRASAVVVSPQEHDGKRIAGLMTSVIIPLCDIPGSGKRKAKSSSENWQRFKKLFKSLGIEPPDETPKTDPTGQRTEAYYFAAMKTLCDPKKPVYISFSTRAWTPPGAKEEIVSETWNGLATSPE